MRLLVPYLIFFTCSINAGAQTAAAFKKRTDQSWKMADSIFHLARRQMMMGFTDSANHSLDIGAEWAQQTNDPEIVTWHSKADLVIYNTAGKEVKRQNNISLQSLQSITMEEFANGLYIIQLTDKENGKTVHGRIIKCK